VDRELFRRRAVKPSERTPDDLELLESLRRGEAEAFEALVVTYQHRVFSIAVRMLGDRSEAEDVAQEVFLRVHRSIRGFRGEAKLSTWLYAITSRLCLNRLKSGSKQRKAGETALERIADGRPDPGATLEASELDAALHRAIAELDDERRIVVVLRDLHGLSYEEIATALDLELGTVRSRLHRARMELKERLERFF
jgi:RNA polymerase sigma-70 factor (ECF subfamily)